MCITSACTIYICQTMFIKVVGFLFMLPCNLMCRDYSVKSCILFSSSLVRPHFCLILSDALHVNYMCNLVPCAFNLISQPSNFNCSKCLEQPLFKKQNVHIKPQTNNFILFGNIELSIWNSFLNCLNTLTGYISN